MLNEIEFYSGCLLTLNKQYDLITILNEVNAWWSLGKFRSIVNAWFEDVKLLEIRGYATIKHYLYALTQDKLVVNNITQ